MTLTSTRIFGPILFFLALNFTRLDAQVQAGVAPQGFYIGNINASVTAATCSSTDSLAFDIDCDNIKDFALRIYKGMTMIDGANTLNLFAVNSAYEICIDSSTFWTVNYTPYYFNLNDPIVLPVHCSWHSDAIYDLGNYGCMMCPGPWSESNKYIAYRKNGQEGWLKISFTLIDGGSCSTAITAGISQVMTPCSTISINEIAGDDQIRLSPNPFSDAALLQSNSWFNNASLQIVDQLGQVVRQINGVNGKSLTIDRAGLAEGLYFIRISENEKIIAVRKMIIY